MKVMKTFIFSLILCLFSNVIMAQDSQETTILSASDTIHNPFGDLLGWSDYPYAEDFDSPIDGAYYTDTIVVSAGMKLNSIEISIIEFNCFDTLFTTNDEGQIVDITTTPRSTFAPECWCVEIEDSPSDLGYLPAVEIRNENGNQVYYLRRDALIDEYNHETGSLSLNLQNYDITNGTFEIRIIHQEPDNLGYDYDQGGLDLLNNGLYIDSLNETFKFVPINWAISWYQGTFQAFNDVAPFYTDGPEVVADSITYNYSYTEYSWENNDGTVEFCENDTLTIVAPGDPDFNFSWYIKWQNGNWLSANPNYVNNNSIEISKAFIESPGVNNTITSVKVEVTNDEGDTLMIGNNSFGFFMYEQPVLEFPSEIDTISNIEGCLYFFEITVNDTLGLVFLDSTLWEVTGGLDLLYFSESDQGGPDATTLNGETVYFCFNGEAGGDDSSTFLVSVPYGVGCTYYEEKYVYIDGNGDPQIKSISFSDTTTVTSTPEFLENTPHDFLLYPNPATDQITLEHDFKGANLSVYDVSGRLVFGDVLTRQNSIYMLEVSDFDYGLYLVIIDDGANRLTKRLVIH